MYFVACVHVFARDFVSNGCIKYFFAPISSTKKVRRPTEALSVISTIRQKSKVGLFAEGNRSV
jgi:hypothetical protein